MVSLARRVAARVPDRILAVKDARCARPAARRLRPSLTAGLDRSGRRRAQRRGLRLRRACAAANPSGSPVLRGRLWHVLSRHLGVKCRRRPTSRPPGRSGGGARACGRRDGAPSLSAPPADRERLGVKDGEADGGATEGSDVLDAERPSGTRAATNDQPQSQPREVRLPPLGERGQRLQVGGAAHELGERGSFSRSRSASMAVARSSSTIMVRRCRHAPSPCRSRPLRVRAARRRRPRTDRGASPDQPRARQVARCRRCRRDVDGSDGATRHQAQCRDRHRRDILETHGDLVSKPRSR